MRKQIESEEEIKICEPWKEKTVNYTDNQIVINRISY